MKNFSFILLLSIPGIVFSQITFEKTYTGLGVAEAYAVQQTQDDGYIVAGFTRPIGASFDEEDFFVIKTNEYGDSVWTRRFGGAESDRATAVIETTDGDYIIVGYSQSFVQNEVRVYMLKIDTNGDTLWTKVYGEIDFYQVYDIKQTYDGGFIMAGYAELGFGNSHDAILVKTDDQGDTLWTRLYGDIQKDIFHSVQQTSDSGFIAAGIKGSMYTVQFDDFYLVKTDSNGYMQWENVYSGPDREVAYAVIQDSTGGYMVSGYTNSFGAGGNDFFLVKSDTNGDSLWARTYGTVNRDDGYAMVHTSDGNYMMAGTIDHDLGMIKINAAGDTIWTKSYGTQNFDFARSVKQTSDGGYIAAGVASISGSKIYLIKTDEDGLITGISDYGSNISKDFLLLQNYPNPFNPITTIEFYLPKPGKVTLKIFNLLGEEVATLLSASLLSGFHRCQWNASNMASGIYYYTIQAGENRAVKKMILLK